MQLSQGQDHQPSHPRGRLGYRTCSSDRVGVSVCWSQEQFAYVSFQS